MKNIIKTIIIALLFCSCDQPTEIVRHSPVIKSISSSRTITFPKEFIDIGADVSDKDEEDELTYLWQSTCGRFVNIHNNPTQWQSPDYPDSCIITLTVSDGYFEVSKSTAILVISDNAN